MKKTVLALIALALISAASCTKNATTGTPAATYGTYSIKGTTYTAHSFIASGPNTLSASTNATGNTADSGVIVYFPGSSLPTATGPVTYIVGGNFLNLPAGHVSLAYKGSEGTYVDIAGNNGTQTVTVSVAAGKVSVAGSNIIMAKTYTSNSDTTNTFSLNLTQQ